MDAKKVREIPNDSSAIYFKEIPAQIAEIKAIVSKMTHPFLSLRDQFAMAALTGILSDPDVKIGQGVATMAYKVADLMLEARKGKG